MAEEDNNIGTALAVVEEQQKVVGSALVAASGTAVLAENSDSSMQILEQIRDIQVKTLRGIGEVVSTMKDIFALDKLQDRRAKEDETENNKENMGNVGNVDTGGGSDINPQDADQQTGGFFGFIGGLPGAGFLKKIIAPITAFFGKSGLLIKLFGKFGPLGALIIGFTLVYRYADDIAKALAPALDALKKIGTTLKPVFDEIMKVADMVVKGALVVIGQTLKLAIEALELGFMTFVNSLVFVKDLLWGLITGDLELVKSAFENLFAGFKEIGDKFINAILQTFTDMTNKVGEIFGFENLFETIKKFFLVTLPNAFDLAVLTVSDFVTNLPNVISSFVKGMFAPIIDFFSFIGDKIKSAINGIIDALPLPDFIKNKIKLETKASKAADNRIDETGVKGKYVDDTITGMQRERMTGGNATMGEASAEFTGEKYGTAKITKSGTSGYDSVSAIMTPEEFTEYNKLDTNGQMDYLKALDDNEQERRVMIKKLHEDKLEFDKANQDYINKYKTAPDEMMSPDDQMLRDDKFQREAKIQASTIPDLANDKKDAVTIVNNNYNTDNSSVATQTDVHSGSLDTGIDKYHDKLATASA